MQGNETKETKNQMGYVQPMCPMGQLEMPSLMGQFEQMKMDSMAFPVLNLQMPKL